MASSGAHQGQNQRMAEGRLGEGLRIVLFAITASCVYGIIQDQITIRVCPEYFTIFHPRLLPLDSYTLIAIQWGIVATWWVGAALGLILSLGALAGPRPPIGWRRVVKPIITLLLFVGTVALASGYIAHAISFVAPSFLIPPQIAEAGPEKAIAFSIDLAAHNAAYLAGFVGGLLMAARVFAGRRRLDADPARP